MSFISYAQNLEDVLLWRALKHVENGFYIDVGANDPVIESVTMAFYERGWHGINIEPIKGHLQDLSLARTRDINLLGAAGHEHGQIELWECEVRGWATASKETILMHETNGFSGKYYKVPVFPLKDICAQYVEGEIHFLKIDVEGFEKNVIDGMDFQKYRPWIVVVEATKPNSSEEIHNLWESSLLDNNYQLAYSDGLNKFYLASEKSELLINLRYPPNVFDRYIRVDQINSELRSEKAGAQAQQASERAASAEAQAQHAAAELTAVHNSLSWRLTAPLRMVSRVISAFLQWSLAQKSVINAIARLLLAHASPYVNRRPKLKSAALGVLVRFPKLKARLRAVVMNKNFGPTVSTVVPTKLAEFTPHARQIYADLKAAIELHQKERR